MSTLHTINKTSTHSALSSCLKVARNGDSILLIEDGVYASSQLCQSPLEGVALYALHEDLLARGLDASTLSGTIKTVDYNVFVDLVCQHQRCVSWS